MVITFQKHLLMGSTYYQELNRIDFLIYGKLDTGEASYVEQNWWLYPWASPGISFEF